MGEQPSPFDLMSLNSKPFLLFPSPAGREHTKGSGQKKPRGAFHLAGLCAERLQFLGGKMIPATFTLTADTSRPLMDSMAVLTASWTALPISGMVDP